MKTIFISGLINLETTARVEGFPIAYTPVRYPFWGVSSTISGVGYNVAKALTTLGDTVRFASLIGKDMPGELARAALRRDGIAEDYIRAQLPQTPQSVILYDETGRRAINVDLKNIQEQTYPPAAFEQAIVGCDLAVLCNINFSRSMLHQVKQRGLPIATDVHTISDLEDDYNRDFMAAADLLFMSNEHLPTTPEDWARQLQARYGTELIVIGLGAEGALLALRQQGLLTRLPAVQTRPVVNTIGAGDALFSAFVHFYTKGYHPQTALHHAIVFASYKIGTKGAAEGFLTEEHLQAWL